MEFLTIETAEVVIDQLRKQIVSRWEKIQDGRIGLIGAHLLTLIDKKCRKGLEINFIFKGAYLPYLVIVELISIHKTLERVIDKLIGPVALEVPELLKRTHIDTLGSAVRINIDGFDGEIVGECVVIPVDAVEAYQAIVVADIYYSVSPLRDGPVLVP
jgi:hypothetical protein